MDSFLGLKHNQKGILDPNEKEFFKVNSDESKFLKLLIIAEAYFKDSKNIKI